MLEEAPFFLSVECSLSLQHERFRREFSIGFFFGFVGLSDHEFIVVDAYRSCKEMAPLCHFSFHQSEIYFLSDFWNRSF